MFDLPELQFNRGKLTENGHHKLQFASFNIHTLNFAFDIGEWTVFDTDDFADFKLTFGSGHRRNKGPHNR